MRVAVLGGTGRSGTLIVTELLRRGHPVSALTRAGGTPALPEGVRVLPGDVRDPAALAELVAEQNAVCSALGQRRGDSTLNSDVAGLLVDAMRATSLRRFVGISGAGIAVAGDRKGLRDRTISALLRRFGGAEVQDKADEYAIWSRSGLDWTLVRPPRLVDGPATGRVDHAASTSPRRTAIARADLAAFVVDEIEQRRYVHAAPLVAGG